MNVRSNHSTDVCVSETDPLSFYWGNVTVNVRKSPGVLGFSDSTASKGDRWMWID